MRANAIIRRYRTRTLEGGFVLKPVHFKNGNTRLRVFPKYVDETDALPIPQHAAQMRERNSSGEQPDLIKITQIVPQTPPADSVSQAPFPVHRADSKELEMIRDVSPTVEAREMTINSSPVMENPPVPDMSMSILDLLFNRNNLQFPSATQPQTNGMSANDLISNGLLPLTTSSFNLSSFATYDQQQQAASVFNSFATIPQSTATTYTNSFMPITSNSPFNLADRKTSEIVYPALAQLRELNIGVTSSSPTAIQNTNTTTSFPFGAPMLTPQVFEDTKPIDPPQPPTPQELAEPFTSNLMIAPSANRSHPFFKKFLNTVKELEKQMLFSMETD